MWIVNAINGQIPSRQVVDLAGIEEEARLLHVAITRAKSRLIVSVPAALSDRNRFKSSRSTTRTRFILDQDIKQHYEVDDRRGQANQAAGGRK